MSQEGKWPPDWEWAGDNAKSKNEVVAAVLSQEYMDAGNWARHYSTVRMTLWTFFFTAGIYAIHQQWNNPQWQIGLLAFAIFTLGTVLFVMFSIETFKQMNRQFEIAISYRKKLEPAVSTTSKADSLQMISPRWHWSSLPFALVLLLLFAVFDGSWVFCYKHQAGNTAEIKIPVSVQLGNAPALSVDVPLKVTVPVQTPDTEHRTTRQN